MNDSVVSLGFLDLSAVVLRKLSSANACKQYYMVWGLSPGEKEDNFICCPFQGEEGLKAVGFTIKKGIILIFWIY